MNISLLISGNLTGFGRFYTSPAAKELLGADKIDLDNHNHIRFLGDNEKAYSITFAQRFIAISLYTRILDSFRRPGELVVTLLIPRNQIIVPNSGSPIGAVYSLLNKICDKFFEKNFQDGMINQNPVVLGQDYYSEILDNYRLKPMNMRAVNLNPSSVKKVGYVKAQEMDIPKYLDTPCRENYNDHNLIIIAQSAPAGIDEEPEEVILYSIHIKNNGATLPGRVKLTSPIYKYQAQAGEKPFPIQGTYKDAVEHLLEPRITARLMPNDVVEISYNFEKEEKTVNFIFLDKNNTNTQVSIDVVQPSVVIDGTKLPISSETFTFRGSEIYASKKLVSDNSNYTISKRSEILDLSRIGNNQDLKVYVEQGFVLSVNFNKPYDVRKSVVFINKLNGQTETVEVTDRKTIPLSGSAADWEFYITSDTYFAPQQPINIISGQWRIPNIEKREVISSPSQTSTTVYSNNDIVTVQKSNRTHGNSNTFLSGGGVSSQLSSPKRKYSYKKLAMVIVPLLCILGGVVYWAINQNKDNDNEGGDEGKELYAYGAYICYYDNTIDETKRDTLTVEQKAQLPLIVSFLEDNSDVELSNYTVEETSISGRSHNLFLQKFINSDIENLNDHFTVRVEYEYEGSRYRIVDQKIVITPQESKDSIETIGVNLQILMSQLGYFDKLKSIKKKGSFDNANEQNTILNEIAKIDNHEIKSFLESEFKKIEVKRVVNPQPVTPTAPKQETVRLDDLSKEDFKFATLSSYKGKENEKLSDGTLVKDRITALTKATDCLNHKDGPCNPGHKNLSEAQKNIIIKAFGGGRTQKIIRDAWTKAGKPKFKSISDFNNFINDNFF